MYFLNALSRAGATGTETTTSTTTTPALSAEEQRQVRLANLERNLQKSREEAEATAAAPPSQASEPVDDNVSNPASTATTTLPLPSSTSSTTTSTASPVQIHLAPDEKSASKPFSKASTATAATATATTKSSTTKPSTTSATATTALNNLSLTSAASVPPVDLSPEKLKEAQDQWESESFSRILQVTLDREAKDGRVFLKRFAEDATYFTHESLDIVLFERLDQGFGGQSAFQYLTACFHRAATFKIERVKNFPRPSVPADQTWCEQSLSSFADRLIRFCAMFLGDTTEEYHSAANRQACMRDFRDQLKRDERTSRTFSTTFLKKMVDFFLESHQPSELVSLFGDALNEIVSTGQQLNLTPTMAVPQLVALAKMCASKQVVMGVVMHPSFLPNAVTGRQLERASLLGSYLSLSPRGNPDLNDIRTRTMVDVDRTVSTLRSEFGSLLLTPLNNTFANLVKVKESRERTLEWLSRVAKLNSGRRKMQFDPMACSSDDFFVNLSQCMLGLCRPIVTAKVKKFDTLAIDYVLGGASARVDYTDVTRLGATSRQVAEEKREEGKEFNFNTECMFVTLEVNHVGIIRTMKHYVEMMQQAQRLQQNHAGMQPSNQQEQFLFDREAAMLNNIYSEIFARKVHLEDPELMKDLMEFYSWICEWLLYLSDTNSPKLRLLPEYIVEDLVEYFVHISRFSRGVLEDSRLKSVVKFLITFVSGPRAIKNPHLRGQFSEVFLALCPEKSGGYSLGSTHVYVTDEFVKQHFVAALLNLYVEVEFGDHQFYSKFSTRHQINEILEFLWSESFYRQQLVELSATEQWVGFMNATINDMMYLLDESLTTLNLIREDQLQMDRPDWEQLPDATRRERETSFRRSENTVVSLMQLANSTVHMLDYMTRVIVKPFVSPAFVNRVAGMLNYYIEKLIGPDVRDVKVRNPEKYHFFPRVLLAEILGIFLNLSETPEFITAVAADERSYKPAVFNKCAAMVRNKAILSERAANRFAAVLSQVAASHASLQQDDVDLGEDIPEEFVDPILQTLMTEPVRLPTSNTVMDLASLKRHLLNTPLDPFTRQPLSLDMVKPEPELKKQIEDWVASKKEEAKLKRTQSEESTSTTTEN